MSQVEADAIVASLNLLSINVYNFWVTEQWQTENIFNLLKFQTKGFTCYFYSFQSPFFPKGTAYAMRLVLSYPWCINHYLKSDSQCQMSLGICGDPSSPQQSRRATGEGDSSSTKQGKEFTRWMKMKEPDSFSVGPSERTRGNGHEL